MEKKAIMFCLIGCLVIGTLPQAFSQDQTDSTHHVAATIAPDSIPEQQQASFDSTLYLIRGTDGRTFKGYILQEDSFKILLLTPKMEYHSILKTKIRSKTVFDGKPVPLQDSTLFRIETYNGDEFQGNLVYEDQEKIVLFINAIGEISIPKKEIKSKVPLSGSMVGKKLWLENPQATRYLWQPNGYGLKKGEGYYQNVWIMFNQISVGITNYFSMGSGMIPIFAFDRGTEIPIWITPKISIPLAKNRFNVGGGALIGTVVGMENSGFGIVYGTVTLGSKDRNISLGTGYAYASKEWSKKPTVTLSAMTRIGPKGYFITENYIIQSVRRTDYLLSFGGRSILKKIGLDYGALFPIFDSQQNFIAIPWLGLTVPFGNR